MSASIFSHIDELIFDEQGLIPCIVIDGEKKEVLMFAFMNKTSIARSLEIGEAVFFSRSRQELWHKGSTSGNVLEIINMRTDCDKDCLLIDVRVHGDGVACHTGSRSCFFNEIPLAHLKKI